MKKVLSFERWIKSPFDEYQQHGSTSREHRNNPTYSQHTMGSSDSNDDSFDYHQPLLQHPELQHPELQHPEPNVKASISAQEISQGEQVDVDMPKRWTELCHSWRLELLHATQQRNLSTTQLRGRSVNGISHEADIIRIGKRTAPLCLLLHSSSRGIACTLTPIIFSKIVRSLRSIPEHVSILMVNTITFDAYPWPLLQLRQRQRSQPRRWSDSLLTNAEARYAQDSQKSPDVLVRHPRYENPVWDEASLQTIERTHFGNVSNMISIDLRMGIQESGSADIYSLNHPQSEQFTNARRIFSQFPCAETLYHIYEKHQIEPVMGPPVMIPPEICVSVVMELGAFDIHNLLLGVKHAPARAHHRNSLFERCLTNKVWLARAQDHAMAVITDALEHLGRDAP